MRRRLSRVFVIIATSIMLTMAPTAVATASPASWTLDVAQFGTLGAPSGYIEAGARESINCADGRICAFKSTNWTGSQYYWTIGLVAENFCHSIGGSWNNAIRSLSFNYPAGTTSFSGTWFSSTDCSGVHAWMYGQGATIVDNANCAETYYATWGDSWTCSFSSISSFAFTIS